VRIILGNSSLANYLEGGGLWSWFLQYPMALKAAGHHVLWLELLQSSGNRQQDSHTIRAFYDRLRRYELVADSAILLFDHKLDFQPLEDAQVFGFNPGELHRSIRGADVLLNFACAVRQPLLSLFKRRALLDGDPGHLQVSALTWDMNIPDHEVLMTIGARINAPDSAIPTLGLRWQTFEPMVYLPAWQVKDAPGRDAPFTSITQWTWEELQYNRKVLSVSKRDAYLKYVKLPRLVHRPMELAANIGSADPAEDARLLHQHGWRVVDPQRVAYSPETYRQYLGASRGEFMCPKPIHVQLRTGWFSDRSLSYLAIGRPVIAEETGFSERIPTGTGLLSFSNIDTAAAAIAEIDASYERHCHAAREIVEAYFNWRKTVETILSACA
jgi:hypothetical protein